MYVKGGDSTQNLYQWAGEGVTGDTFLHSPVNPNNPNGKFFGLSHIDICYDPTEIPQVVLDISKTASATYDCAYMWEIEKSVDDESLVLFDGGEATVTYSIVLTKSDECTPVPGSTIVTGEIAVANDGPGTALNVNVFDVLSDATVATISGCDIRTDPDIPGTATDLPVAELAEGEILVCDYSATASSNAAGTNEARATADNADPSPVSTGQVAYTPVLDATLNNCVDVDDDKYDAGDLQNVCESTAEPHTYEVTITADGCEQEVITNTATVIGDDGEELDSDDATVTVEKVCVTVQKRANSSFDRDCTWRLDKAVVGEDEQIVAAGESATFSYEVTLAGSCEDSNFVVSGGIRITNDGTADVTINSVADVLDDGTVASVDCGAAVFPVTLEPGEVLGCSYTASPDDMSSTLNTATASTSSDAGNQDFSGTAAVSWGAPTNTTDECVTVVDDQYGPLGEFCVDRRAGTFGPEVIAEYDLTVGPVANCDTEELVNTATATANDTGTRVSDSETVSASVPCFGCTPG
jgi:hypothetical protein